MADRNNAIFKLYKSGHSINDLTKEYNLSESSIRKIISKVRKEKLVNINLVVGGFSYE